MDLFKSAIRSARAFQLRVRGESTNRSPASSTTATMATMARTCWRFLMLMFSNTSRLPAKIKRELLLRRFAADVIDLQIRYFFAGAQLVEHFQKRQIIARHAGTGHR